MSHGDQLSPDYDDLSRLRQQAEYWKGRAEDGEAKRDEFGKRVEAAESEVGMLRKELDSLHAVNERLRGHVLQAISMLDLAESNGRPMPETRAELSAALKEKP